MCQNNIGIRKRCSQRILEPRVTVGLPTYRKKNRPKSVHLQLLRGRQSFTVNLPAGECPTLIIMPHLKVPAFMGDYDYERGVMVVGCSLHGPSDMKERLARLDADGFSVSVSGALVSFARMLAKIAYGMSILQFGLHAFKEVFVLPCILGQKDDAGRWVGCSQEPAVVPKVDKLLHSIEVASSNGIAGVHIRLFANYRTPVYLVLVGSLKQATNTGRAVPILPTPA